MPVTSIAFGVAQAMGGRYTPPSEFEGTRELSGEMLVESERVGRGTGMLDRTFFRPILDDELLTRGLGDEEARLLVDWLVERAENLAASTLAQVQRVERLESLCRRGRSICRFVTLWCHENRFGAAIQLAGAESFSWNLPVGMEDPAELMCRILRSEERADLAAA